MSKNICIYGVREILVIKTEKTENQYVWFNCQQTPTVVTNKILASDDPIEAYVKWVREQFNYEEKEPIYADGDIFGDLDPIGYNVYNVGQELETEFREWFDQVTQDGYEVKIYGE